MTHRQDAFMTSGKARAVLHPWTIGMSEFMDDCPLVNSWSTNFSAAQFAR
jgi:hypothetical protein